jgi:hypothetical protein
MNIPPELLLSVEDIRHLKHSQLSLLTGINSSSFAAWNHQRRLSERSLERIAQRLGLSKPELLQGFEGRVLDVLLRSKS